VLESEVIRMRRLSPLMPTSPPAAICFLEELQRDHQDSSWGGTHTSTLFSRLRHQPLRRSEHQEMRCHLPTHRQSRISSNWWHDFDCQAGTNWIGAPQRLGIHWPLGLPLNSPKFQSSDELCRKNLTQME
jgi:hypothetical protein